MKALAEVRDAMEELLDTMEDLLGERQNLAAGLTKCAELLESIGNGAVVVKPLINEAVAQARAALGGE